MTTHEITRLIQARAQGGTVTAVALWTGAEEPVALEGGGVHSTWSLPGLLLGTLCAVSHSTLTAVPVPI